MPIHARLVWTYEHLMTIIAISAGRLSYTLAGQLRHYQNWGKEIWSHMGRAKSTATWVVMSGLGQRKRSTDVKLQQH